MKIFNAVLLKNYDSVFEKIGNDTFFIFGITKYANTFYLNCVKRKIEKNIKAFIISDLNNTKRKSLFYHGIPIHDITWLNKHSEIKKGFWGAFEKILYQIGPIGINSNIYFVPNCVNRFEYAKLYNESYQTITEYYNVMENIYEDYCFDLFPDNNDTTYYKYTPLIDLGYLCDKNIFNDKTDIGNLFFNQLGDYVLVKNEDDESSYKCTIYSAKSHFDKKLIEDFNTPFTYNIQVGAALTDVSIEEIKDNSGDNISARNKDYCELTALYWAWRNDTTSNYIGLCHYRRKFVITEKILNYVMNENYDAVYTIPKLFDVGMREEFVERNYFITDEMWNLITMAINKLCPEYQQSWLDFSKSFFSVQCNMSIMRRDVFNQYCSWLFPILNEIDSFYLSQGIQRNDRYLGYIAECLNTVYIMKNKNHLKKCFVEVKLLKSEL